MSLTFSRRRLLAAATLTAGAAMSGCTGGDSGQAPTPTTPPPEEPDPLEPILTGTLALFAAYDNAAESFPGLAMRLAPLRAQTAEHVRALQLALAVPTMTPSSTAAASASAVPTGSPPASGTGTSPPGGGVGTSPPGDPVATLAGLRARLGVIRSATGQLCLTTSTQRAPLLGSLTAAAACHDLLLA